MQSWFVAFSFVVVSLFAGMHLLTLRRKIFLGAIRRVAARLDVQTEAISARLCVSFWALPAP